MADAALGLRATLAQVAPIPLQADIACAPGEVLALVGPSGSGKSTLLRAIAGLHAPRQGRIECAGNLWFDATAGVNLSTARRRVGMVFQSYALFPHLDALANVREGMDDPDSPAAWTRARQLLARVHLGGLEERRPHQLSGGQQQRVAVARALARDPRVLLLDEPFSAVDRLTRERLYGELAELRRGLEMPVLLVTHDLDEAVMLADRMTILARGRTIQSGPPLAVMQRPATVEAARLVGLRNLFAGKVLAHEREAGYSLLGWYGRQLKVRLQEGFPPGAPVAWALPAAGVLLMPRDHPARGALDNAVAGQLVKILGLGEIVHIRVEVAGTPGEKLMLSMTRHIATRYALAEGQPLALRLRGEQIHLMPPG